ncbi:MAG: NAD(P)H-dependent oxidoreductase [Enterobacteriaceae bacterium]|jgi:NAD(P)H-dependent FMN reductase|nr:NAD(P)H-dependent oxidoreductase [Enterobacteriaceae bacterium]
MNKYVIVSCSSRENNQSSRVAAVINNLIIETDGKAQTEIIDLAKTKYQEWNNACWGKDIPCKYWRQGSKILAESDGIIFVVPEWHGMIPPALSNLLILAERNELAHKPALIVSISGGSGGAYPMAQLKGFSNKNNRLCYIPDHVIIRNVSKKALMPEDNDYKHLLYSLSILSAYMSALTSVRNSGVVDYDSWPYGM